MESSVTAHLTEGKPTSINELENEGARVCCEGFGEARSSKALGLQCCRVRTNPRQCRALASEV